VLKGGGSTSSGTWNEQISNRITFKSLVRRFEYHVIGSDLEGHPRTTWMTGYNRPMSVSTQPSERPTTVYALATCHQYDNTYGERRWRRRIGSAAKLYQNKM